MISDWPHRPTKACLPYENCEKRCSPFDLAAPGSAMPVSELKSASFRQPINTEIWDVTMTAKAAFHPGQKFVERWTDY